MSWERLADEVRARRAYLGLSQGEIRQRGGLSVDTLRKVENNRAHRLSPRLRRGLERALTWETGSIDDILAGGRPRVVPEDTTPAPPQSFELAETVLNLKGLVERQLPALDAAARAAVTAEMTTYAKEAEESIIKMMPWLDDDDRGEAIRILTELRRPM